MLSELVSEAARQVPDRPVVVSAAGDTTYAACDPRAEALAAGLHGRGIERFGTVVGDVPGLIALVTASTAIGAEACIYSYRLDDEGIDDTAATFGHDLVITDRSLALAKATPLGLDALPGEGDLPAAPASAPALILTTGTTGRPKGARHDWHRLAAPVVRQGGRDGARWLLAYNLNQFAGVQILLHVLATRSTLVVPESNQPRQALDAIRAHGVTCVSATPTFWRFVVALLAPDEARALAIEQITLGGEAVPAPLLDDLHRLFPDARISQVYAGTEFGSSVSVTDGKSGLPLSVLERGDDADVQLRIVDGQLHLRSRRGMLGYFAADEVDESEWRPTGDLVEVRDDRIVFVGRVTDTINVGGVKVHPLPVEEAITRVPGVELVRVYGRDNAVTGQIVMAEVVASSGVDTDELETSIREACATLPDAAQPRRIKFVESIDVNENKIARKVKP